MEAEWVKARYDNPTGIVYGDLTIGRIYDVRLRDAGYFYDVRRDDSGGTGRSIIPACWTFIAPDAPSNVSPGGVKSDTGKTRWDLLPGDALSEVADIMTFGAAKYGERNWEDGMSWARLFAALCRHVWSWWRREGNDAETGRSHMAHAACCALFLLTYELRNKGTDNRVTY